MLPVLKELERDHVFVVYPHERLCQSTCRVYLDGQVLYSDSEHLTMKGADLLRPLLVQQLLKPPVVH